MNKMFSKTVIVLVAFAVCQGVASLPKDIQADVHTAIGAYQTSVHNAISEGSDKMSGILEEIAVASASMEKGTLKKIDEFIMFSMRQINLIFVEARAGGFDANACWQTAMYSLDTLRGLTSNDVRNCGWNVQQQSQSISNEILDTLSRENYYNQQGFYAQYNACLDQEITKCMNNLLTRIRSEAKSYPQEITLRINQSAELIGVVGGGLSQCIDRADSDAKGQSEMIVVQMQKCVA